MTNPTGHGWKGKSVLVTGATGFLGSHLTKRLLDAKANVIVLERDFEVRSYLVRTGGLRNTIRIRGDIRDYDLLERILAEYEVTHVIHLASLAIVKQAEKAPIQALDQNIMGCAKLLEACRHVGSIQRIIVSSSDKAYGSNRNLPYHEDYPLQGRNPYDCSKSAQDLVAQMYMYTYNLPITIFRSGNLFGPGDINESRIIPKTITKLLNGQPPVIYGDGTMQRDFIYVDDVARACMFLLDKNVNGAFNVGTGKPYTVKEVIAIISRLMGVNIEPIYEGVNNEIDSQWLDISKIKSLGWKPEYTFEDGLKETIKHYESLSKR